MFKRLFYPVLIGCVLIVASSTLSAHYGLFHVIPNSDKLFHFTGGVIAAWLVLIYVADDLNRLSLAKRYLLILGGVCLIGVVWEWTEYLVGEASLRYAPHFYPYFHIGNLTDTLGDLVADLLGAALLAWVWLARRLS